MPKIATVVQLDTKELNHLVQDHAKDAAKAEAGGSSIKWIVEGGEVKGAIVRFGSKVDEEAALEEPEVVEPESGLPEPAPGYEQQKPRPKPSDAFGAGIGTTVPTDAETTKAVETR